MTKSSHGPGGLVITTRPVTVNKTDAAGLLGISVDSFERYVQPELRIIRHGRLRLVPVTELERWADEHAERVFS